jgi:HK97 family phage portal protein
MNFLQNQLQGFLGYFATGTDRFTRSLNLPHRLNLNYLIGQQEVYETYNDNEFNLFQTTPEIYIPVMKKATMFSNGVFRVKDYKTGEIIENHPLLKLLEKPNPMSNRNEWLIEIAVNDSIYGNAYILKNQSSMLSEFPSTLTSLPNAEIIIEVTGKKWSATTVEDVIKLYKMKSTKDTFEPSEIIHIKNYSNDGVRGISPLQSLMMPVSNTRAMYGFVNVNASKKGALGLISAESNANGTVPLNEQDRLDMEKQYAKETHGIFDGQSPIKFSNKPVKYQNLAYPINTQMPFETINHGMRKVIDAIGLNEHIFSNEQNSTFNNATNGLKMAYQDCIIPFAERFCFALNDNMNLFEKGYYVEMDFSHIPALQENQTEKAQQMKMKAEAVDRLIQVGYTRQQAELILGISFE